MKLINSTPKQSLNKAYLKEKVGRIDIEKFKKNFSVLLGKINEQESEEHHKNIISEFLKDTWYKELNEINTKDRKDLVIHSGKTSKDPVGVIIEVKKPNNKSEMINEAKPNTKAMHEIILYYLRERIECNNVEIKHLIITNIYEWYIIDEVWFDKYIYRNVKIRKDYEGWKLSGHDTKFFYDNIAKPFLDLINEPIPCTYIDIRKYEETIKSNELSGDNKLISLYKIISPVHLLKQPFANDSNSLNPLFYSELLHIIGLEEIQDGNKWLIKRKSTPLAASLIENTIAKLEDKEVLKNVPELFTYGKTDKDQIFNLSLELCITWINRILFLKLLESQLFKYHKANREFLFLNIKTIFDFNELNNLFFLVLAEKTSKRREYIKDKYNHVPYLNSSLFERTQLERFLFDISALDNRMELNLFNETVLKDIHGKRRTGNLPLLQYLFEFLDAYDFTSEGKEEIQEENKNLINASVLGLIFEKINGYKEGSYFTPGFVTMYICKETIRRGVINKFNEYYNINCESFNDLKNFISNRFKPHEILESNSIINNLKICDPAVGSGHFLVSALNELIAIKAELGILADKNGICLTGYEVKIENDELIVTYNNNSEIFEYSITNGQVTANIQRTQSTLFHEKELIIESCLFGVDINPNSVKICRLRLWIELLKNAYYKNLNSNEQLELETLPNIDINIKLGNSLINRFDLDSDLTKALKDTDYNVKQYREFVNQYKSSHDKDHKRELEEIIDGIKDNFQDNIDDSFKSKISRARGEVTKISTEINTKEQWKEKVSKELQSKLEKAKLKLAQLEVEKSEILNNKVFNNSFEWRFQFPEVLDDKGTFEGFDIIIGNPPYGDYFSALEKKYILKAYKESFSGTVDIYIPFFELGLKIIKNKGILSYITPHTFTEYSQFKAIRTLLVKDNSINQLIKMTGVFQDAVVDNVIIILTKGNSQSEYIKAKVFKTKVNNILTTDLHELHNSILTKDGYLLQNPGNFNVEKLKSNSISLGDYAKITQGITTGGNECFLGEEEEFVNLIPSTEIKKTLRGEDISSYYLSFNNEFIIYAVKTMPEDSHKKIEAFLEPHKEKLSKKRETLQGKLPWYCLHWPRNKEDYERPKILIRQTANKIIGVLDTENYFPIDSIHTINLKDEQENEEKELKYLLGLLNSKLFKFLYQLKLNEEGKVFPQVKKANIEWMPIKIASSDIKGNIINLVDKVLFEKRVNNKADISSIEYEIDKEVYKCYNLNTEEIEHIEQS